MPSPGSICSNPASAPEDLHQKSPSRYQSPPVRRRSHSPRRQLPQDTRMECKGHCRDGRHTANGMKVKEKRLQGKRGSAELGREQRIPGRKWIEITPRAAGVVQAAIVGAAGG